MKERQASIYKETKKILKPDSQYTIKVKPIVLDREKGKCITVNECNAAEKIEGYPEAIQKLVWRALHYKCEINSRQSMPRTTNEDYTKLTKYIEGFRHSQKLLLKMCKRRNLKWIIIEGGI